MIVTHSRDHRDHWTTTRAESPLHNRAFDISKSDSSLALSFSLLSRYGSLEEGTAEAVPKEQVEDPAR